MAENNPNATDDSSSANAGGGGAIPEGPTDRSAIRIPLPDHGFEPLDLSVRELAAVPAAEMISRVAASLLNAAGERLGLAPGEEPDLDLDEARALIDTLSGLLAGAQGHLGDNEQTLRDGVRTLQHAFREASAHPDAPGDGPGEKFLA